MECGNAQVTGLARHQVHPMGNGGFAIVMRTARRRRAGQRGGELRKLEPGGVGLNGDRPARAAAARRHSISAGSLIMRSGEAAPLRFAAPTVRAQPVPA
jgi:hypothetical protein